MRYKAKVLKRFPGARTVTESFWSTGEVRRVVVQIPIPVTERWATIDAFRRDPQGHAAAWRSAFYWCVRNPELVE